jgi:hypothetical protein
MFRPRAAIVTSIPDISNPRYTEYNAFSHPKIFLNQNVFTFAKLLSLAIDRKYSNNTHSLTPYSTVLLEKLTSLRS